MLKFKDDADSPTFDRPRLGKVELQLVRLELEVGSSLGAHLDEGRQIALEAGQLEVRNFQNVVADVVQETRVVADHDARDVRERLDVVLDPLDVHHI